MDRRKFLTTSAVAAAAAPLATPALAQGTVQWKMVTSWPKNLPGPGVHAQTVADRITALSAGRIEVILYAAGELVPGRGVFDAVSQGTAEMYHSVPAYWGSKSIGLEFFGGQPGGLTADEQLGWILYGGGQELYDESYERFGMKPFVCGNSGPQMAGWYRDEINSPDDYKGMKFRTAGLNSKVMTNLGASVLSMGGRDMFQALQTGVLDAGEFVGPWTDSALGFYEVAPYYYAPSIGEPASCEEVSINLEAWNSLPDDLKLTVQVACESLYAPVTSEYLTVNAKALPQMVAEKGVKLRELPESVLVAIGNAAGEVIAEIRDHDDELVRRTVESFLAYRATVVPYRRYSDNGVMNARYLDFDYG